MKALKSAVLHGCTRLLLYITETCTSTGKDRLVRPPAWFCRHRARLAAMNRQECVKVGTLLALTAFTIWLVYSFTAMTNLTVFSNMAPEVTPLPDVVSQDQVEVTSQQQVLLVTRGRSGSSFTSELIQYHRKVFMLFEPLQRKDDWFLRTSTKIQRDQRNRVIGFNIWRDDKFNWSVSRLQEFLTCNLTSLDDINIPEFRKHPDTENVTKCMDDKTLTSWQHVRCYLDFIRDCRARDVIYAKSIRFRVKWAEKLLQKLPNFKLLFLIRDPRAVLHSQSRVWPDWFDFVRDIDAVSQIYCREMEEDLKHFRLLKELFPHRVKVIRYEDSVVDPHLYTEDIYSFLRLEYSQRTASHIRTLTSSTRQGYLNSSFLVYRKDPLATANAWRKSSPFKSISVIDRHCGHLYHLLGYRRIASQADLVSSQNLVLKIGL